MITFKVIYCLRKKKLSISIFGFLAICYFISQIANIVFRIVDETQYKLAQEELLRVTVEENSQIELLTDLKDEKWLDDGEYNEFNYDIKIPLPNYIIEKEDILSCQAVIETNNIAYRFPAVKITYGLEESTASLILDIFRERLPKDHNYEQVLYYFEDGTKIYTRNESDGYFSYIIIKGCEATFGVCHGKPELKLD